MTIAEENLGAPTSARAWAERMITFPPSWGAPAFGWSDHRQNPRGYAQLGAYDDEEEEDGDDDLFDDDDEEYEDDDFDDDFDDDLDDDDDDDEEFD